MEFKRTYTIGELIDYPVPAPDGQGRALSCPAGAGGLNLSGLSGPPGLELDRKVLPIIPRGQKAKNRGGVGDMRREAYRDLWDVDARLDRIESELVDLGPELESWVFADQVWGVLGQLREVVGVLNFSVSAWGTEKAQVF